MAPPTVLVDADYRLLNLSETAGRYLLMPAGPPSQDLTQIVRPELRLDVGAALRRAFEKGEATLSGPIPVRFNGAPHNVILNVRPVTRGGASGEALVMFIEGASTLAAPHGRCSGSAGARSTRWSAACREELTLAQDQLRSSRQEYEATNEELRAANEELQSINEEYRSTSEELETSKEELQSMNEELQTLNAELKAKLDEHHPRQFRSAEPDGGDRGRHPVPRFAIAHPALHAAHHRPFQHRAGRRGPAHHRFHSQTEI